MSPHSPSTAPGSVRLFQGHASEHLSPETELVVYSDAVPSANPELRRAAELGIPTLSYFQMLGRLGVGRRTVAIAGTHGKSTVTAMLAHLLIHAGRDPTVVCGATPMGATSGGRAGCVITPLPWEQGPGVRARDRDQVLQISKLPHLQTYAALSQRERRSDVPRPAVYGRGV